MKVLLWKRFYWKLRRTYIRLRYGIVIDMLHGSMPPQLGKGKFVSVYRKGDYFEIVCEKKRMNSEMGIIRLIPYQPNHGVMVEFIKDGKLQWRTGCDYDAFYNMGINEQENI